MKRGSLLDTSLLGMLLHVGRYVPHVFWYVRACTHVQASVQTAATKSRALALSFLGSFEELHPDQIWEGWEPLDVRVLVHAPYFLAGGTDGLSRPKWHSGGDGGGGGRVFHALPSRAVRVLSCTHKRAFCKAKPMGIARRERVVPHRGVVECGKDLTIHYLLVRPVAGQ